MTATQSATPATGVRTIKNYVGGRWVASQSERMLDVSNPATGEVLARVPLSTPAELDAAVAAAREAGRKYISVASEILGEAAA